MYPCTPAREPGRIGSRGCPGRREGEPPRRRQSPAAGWALGATTAPGEVSPGASTGPGSCGRKGRPAPPHQRSPGPGQRASAGPEGAGPGRPQGGPRPPRGAAEERGDGGSGPADKEEQRSRGGGVPAAAARPPRGRAGPGLAGPGAHLPRAVPSWGSGASAAGSCCRTWRGPGGRRRCPPAGRGGGRGRGVRGGRDPGALSGAGGPSPAAPSFRPSSASAAAGPQCAAAASASGPGLRAPGGGLPGRRLPAGTAGSFPGEGRWRSGAGPGPSGGGEGSGERAPRQAEGPVTRSGKGRESETERCVCRRRAVQLQEPEALAELRFPRLRKRRFGAGEDSRWKVRKVFHSQRAASSQQGLLGLVGEVVTNCHGLPRAEDCGAGDNELAGAGLEIVGGITCAKGTRAEGQQVGREC